MPIEGHQMVYIVYMLLGIRDTLAFGEAVKAIGRLGGIFTLFNIESTFN